MAPEQHLYSPRFQCQQLQTNWARLLDRPVVLFNPLVATLPEKLPERGSESAILLDISELDISLYMLYIEKEENLKNAPYWWQ